MMARCDGTVRICPSKRPLFSAKPSPIIARPSQYVNIDNLIANIPDSTSRPSPSAWIIRNPVNLTALGLPRPEALVSRLSFPFANITEMIKPVKLQELLINIGCTFRMPLENIRITNITMLDADGKLQIVTFDKTLVNLNSSRIVVCLPRSQPSQPSQPSTTAANLLSRRLQQSGSGSGNNINVDYAILNPSDNILSLDDAEFQTVVASSALADYQASIGSVASVGVSNTADPNTSAMMSLTDDARIRIGLGVGLGVTGFVAFAAIGTLMFQRRRKPSTRRSSTVNVVFAQTSNPINNGEAFNLRMTSDRRVFNPIGSRV
jgi:hypothetical protein